MTKKTSDKAAPAIMWGSVIIGNAIIWGLVMIGCASALKGTGAYAEIQNILVGGSTTSFILVSGGLVGSGILSAAKKKESSPDTDKE